MIKRNLILSGFVALVAAGCVHRPASSAESGRAVFTALQQAVVDAGERVKPSVVLVEIEREKGGQQAQMVGNMRIVMGGQGPRSFPGVVLTSEGHVLVGEKVAADGDDRIQVWVNGIDYEARPLKTDDQLGMTILKIDTDETLEPLDLGQVADLQAGEWAVVATPGGEDQDFRKLIAMVFCRGEQAGRYRNFMIDQLPNGARGAPVVNLDGAPVGLVTRGGVISFQDAQEDLVAFLDEARGVALPEDEERSKAWLGILFDPVNKYYARTRDLPPGALWITQVGQGSPAERAGVQSGDLILSLNGRRLPLSGSRSGAFFTQTLRARLDRPFELTVLRDGREVTCSGRFDLKPEPETLRAEDMGIDVVGITDLDIFARNLFATEGVMVDKVQRGSAAATGSSFRQGLLMPGDVITELAGQPTPDIKTFARILEEVRREQPAAVLVKYKRGRTTGFAGLNLSIGEKSNGERP